MSDAIQDWERLYDDVVSEGLTRALARNKRARVFSLGLGAVVFATSWWGFSLFPDWFAGGGRAGGGVNHFSMALFALVPGILAWWFGSSWLQKSTLKIFGERVLAPIARLVDPDMRYDADKSVGGDVLDASLLFDLGGDGIVRLDDRGVFQGRIAGDEFVFASLCVDKRMRHGCRLRGGRIFDGLFLRLRTKRDIGGFVVVAPRASGVDCTVLKERIAVQGRETVVEVPLTENEDLDRWFRRFASDEAIARRFNPSVKKWMAELVEEQRWQPSCSHVGRDVFVILNTGRRHWRLPGSDADAHRKEVCRRYFEDMALMLGVAAKATGGKW